MTDHMHDGDNEETGTTAMLSEVRQQIHRWETAPPGSREENEAAEAATRAMAELDSALCAGGHLPVPWKGVKYPQELI
jgi:hypothetical protein